LPIVLLLQCSVLVVFFALFALWQPPEYAKKRNFVHHTNLVWLIDPHPDIDQLANGACFLLTNDFWQCAVAGLLWLVDYL
jgi:hypothetical protein